MLSSSTASTLFGVAGWAYIPDFATRHCLNFLHQYLRSRGHEVPQPGSNAWIRHYRYTFAVVVLGYLIYNLVQASLTAPASFFQIVGVSPDADENTLTKAFRAFARTNHPDRVGKQGEELFVQVRLAYESLKNPTLRFAYQRFGPDVLDWRDCRSEKDYLQKGLWLGSGYYLSSAVLFLSISALTKGSSFAFWRYVLLFAFMALELTLLVEYDSIGVFAVLFPNKVAFQHVFFLHQLFMFLSIALSRVVPVLFPEPVIINPNDERTYKPFLDRLIMLAQAADHEVSRMLHTELNAIQGTKPTSMSSSITPCQLSDADIDELSREMENMIVEQQLRSSSPIRSAWDAAVERGREAYVATQRQRQRSPRRPPPLRRDSSRSPVKNGLAAPLGRSATPESRNKELATNGHMLQALDSAEETKMPSPLSSRPPSRTSSPFRPAASL